MISFKKSADGQVVKKVDRAIQLPKERVKKEILAQTETLTDGQKKVFEAIVNGDRNIFLSGEAGTGKSYVVKLAIDYLRRVNEKWVAVCASTASASRILGEEGAITVHKFYGFQPEVLLTDKGKGIAHATKTTCKPDVIFIDECSMIRADTFMSIKASVDKANKKRQKEGKAPQRVICVADFCQIPPVLVSEDKQEIKEKLGYDIGEGWCFLTQAWQDFNFQNFMLSEVKRQKDPEFTYHLNKIRQGDGDYTNWFNHHCSLGYNPDAVSLFPYNWMVKDENLRRLGKIKGINGEDIEEKVYTADLFGKATAETVEANGLDYELHVKRGCRVMFRCNPYSGADWCELNLQVDKDKYIDYFCNGSTGTLVDYGTDGRGDYLEIEVDGHDGISVKIYKKVFDTYEYVEVAGKLKKVKSIDTFFEAMPITLAYALSFHKSQGCSIPKINVYPKSFSSGMLYVALSRCSGGVSDIYLNDMIRPEAACLSPAVKEFYDNLIIEN